MHEGEGVCHAVVQNRRFGAYRWRYRLNVRASSAGRFRLFSVGNTGRLGRESTGDIDVASGGSCLFPIRIRGTVSSSDILQKPLHGKLKRLNTATYEYRAKARFKGKDTFAIKATGQGPTASGTSVITVHATIK